MQRAHDLLDAANNDSGGNSCQYCSAEGYDGNGLLHDADCILPTLRHLLNPPPRKPPVIKDVYTENELRFAAYVRCSCGAGMAYPPEGYPAIDYWDCSDILLGLAIPSGQPGAVKHEARLPFSFYEIKSEDQPSAGGATTRRRASS